MVIDVPPSRAINFTRDRISTEGDYVAKWQPTGEDALILAFLVERINELFHMITTIDTDAQSQTLRGLPFDPELDERIGKLFSSWAVKFRPILELVNSGRWPAVDGANELQQNFREVEGILTPDDEFFTGDKLASLRDAAIDAEAAGETEPW